MMPFRRRPAPPFWAEKETQWARRTADWPKLDPLDWRHDGRTLREWFHEVCREASEPILCAYCDGELYLTARATVDHFAPRSRFQALSLAWHNLFPVCDLCNETYKRDQWSCALVRPDTDPVGDWFDIDLETGVLRPDPEIADSITRGRVRLTICVLRLNTPGRCKARREVVRTLQNAWKKDARTQQHDRSMVDEYIRRGPYRFVASRAKAAMPASTRDPIAPSR
jgi:uncharacterized protein (TIGR02646 family)